ncbi:MAG: helix-turn-helix domain-containing protein [Mesorhizobium sp.]|uniref:helix-turn-helix domain-containing protein n=1 Tax=unclassified Mesorhizobium TaxID=325217 RepID=UPI000F75E4EE|nr:MULTISPECIES: helix-turn-helix transcriptional regulator [unclassified Mesorhizobium]RVC81769.1 helix-turn-helix domain-containing protein [Mesorhizobium sp. M2A.F.Ca.ET.046.02.1.1]AZO33556.1 XRE family transcriptional regulator [Mesorhizobium sp. M2A.F.Ca.ET.046.03.2.1]RWB42770.1 MAG: helix-turn-helix domain-containing protein [Mesorhizobium sp.]RWC57902.1 MAG: helix-turn-helix domain-containing protein [Mesorhizobium sp.]RWE22012.1 MAG: helix-turn-helix domain-containing protein [Mesorhiz
MKGRALLAWNLRRIRVDQGLSQDRLAADTQVDRAYLGGIERQTENPSLDLMDRLATVLGVSLAELLRQPAPDEEPPKPLRSGRRGRRAG